MQEEVGKEGVFVDNHADAAQADTLEEQKAFGIAYAKGILKTLGVKDNGGSNAGNNTDNAGGGNHAGGEIKVGDTVTFTGGGVYKSSTAEQAAKQNDKTSVCKVTAVNPKGTRPYHLISQDGKGVWGWVNAESVKGATGNAPNGSNSIEKGDTVTFTGGAVYKSSTAAQAAKTKDVTSTCKVTATNPKGTHPYHCVSQDGKGVYGWVDKASVKK